MSVKAVVMFGKIIVLCFFLSATSVCLAQTDSTENMPKYDYQIYLPKPAKEIKQLLYEKDCTPIKGSISDGKKYYAGV